MIWTSTNLVIQMVAGVLGAHFVATAAHEHGFGFIGHTIAGLIAGALSGYFLQKLAVTVVTASGSLNDVDAANNAVLQGLTGLTAGGCLMLRARRAQDALDGGLLFGCQVELPRGAQHDTNQHAAAAVAVMPVFAARDGRGGAAPAPR